MPLCCQPACRCLLAAHAPDSYRLRWFNFVSLLVVLPCSYLNDNALTGGLPDSWSGPGAFPGLSLLRIDGNALSGPLPPRLGSGGAGGNASAANMPNLSVL